MSTQETEKMFFDKDKVKSVANLNTQIQLFEIKEKSINLKVNTFKSPQAKDFKKSQH